MITFALRCEPAGHGFDGWFRSSADFERQQDSHLVECPVCGSHQVAKALMAPAVSTAVATAVSGSDRPQVPASYTAGEAAEAFAKLQALAREVRQKADYVGPRFAEEARRIHYGESEARQIYGEATPSEVGKLAEEGIAALPLPPLPEDAN
ncbi:DUF1178 family protein [Mangrovicella endophytica]|uniref:DUF1178 family protein n=1 Tax=Mangrovicella endophytica TaxID=2066697 RepID=UPI000C9DF698|nr:DUF1178 family protein [Mangrovicella endophytica]